MINRYLILLVLMFLLGCSSPGRKNDLILDYIESIKSIGLQEDKSYILVSDYSCSACKEEIYVQIEAMVSDVHYIVMDPRNKAILKERFQAAISQEVLFIDTLGLNKKMEIILDKPLRIVFQSGEWIKAEL